MKPIVLIRALLLPLLIIGLFTPPAHYAVQAAPCVSSAVVMNTSDSGAGSLRQAIADACNGADITFDASLAGQTIGLTSGELVLDKILIFDALALKMPVTVSGSHLSRVFNVSSPVAVFQNMIIADGRATDCPDAAFGACGGGILADGGILVLIYIEVKNNAATSPAGSAGGGIMVFKGTNASSQMIFEYGTVSGNQADVGGGLYASPDSFYVIILSSLLNNTAAQRGGAIYSASVFSGSSRAIVAESTLAGNSAGVEGGGIYNDNVNDASMELLFVTIAGNSAPDGGGIFSSNGGNGINLGSTILAGNTGHNCNAGTNFTSLGFNMSSDATCESFAPDHDSQNTDPMLGVLGNYGGRTQTIPLLAGSPAIDGGGDCSGSINVDQREVTRPVPAGGLCDAGAFEYDPVPAVAGSVPADGASLTSGPSTVQVTFNKDMLNDDSSEAVNNVENYILVERGANAFFDTVSCLDGANADDVNIAINSVSYDSGTRTATLNVNGGTPLPNGVYRLFVCGTTSITDEYNLKLNYGNSDTLINFTVAPASPPPAVIPATGFAMGRTTVLPVQPAARAYGDLGDLWLEIPRLGVRMPIVGVPLEDGSWDISWLGESAGWLDGSAYPTWAGNSVITGHVWNADDTAGPFARLNTLGWNDQIIVHAGGASYIYALRSVLQVSPGSVAAMLKHEDRSWITLVSCRGYDPLAGAYKYRILVRAVLIDVK